MAERIDEALGAHGALVECAVTVEEGGQPAEPAAEDDVHRRSALKILGLAGAGLTAAPLESLRSGLDAATPRLAPLAAWEAAAEGHARRLRFTPTVKLLADVAVDVADYRPLLIANADRPGYQRVAAQLAALMAYALSESGDAAAAQRWWRTAGQHVEAAGDPGFAAWIYARQAVGLDWSAPGDQLSALKLVDAARSTTHRPCAGLAEAQWVRAAVLAHAGRDREADTALAELDDLAAGLPTAVAQDGDGYFWGWGGRRHEIETSWVRVLRGEHDATAQVLDLDVPPEDMSHRWWAEARLTTARGLVRAGDADAGLQTGLSTYSELAPAYRSATVDLLARRVVSSLPSTARALPAAREMRALVTGA